VKSVIKETPIENDGGTTKNTSGLVASLERKIFGFDSYAHAKSVGLFSVQKCIDGADGGTVVALIPNLVIAVEIFNRRRVVV
jgi:hypothetical protein